MEGVIATIMLFAGNFAPRNWAFCDGRLLAISQNTALFSILGTIYGGDGQTTFALPDLRGRVPVGPGSGSGLTPVQPGEIGGRETTVLSPLNLPPQTHTGTLKNATLQVSSQPGDSEDPGGKTLAKTDISQRGGDPITGKIYGSNPNETLASGSVTGEVEINTQGQGTAFENRMPYTGVHYIICLNGIYPSRN